MAGLGDMVVLRELAMTSRELDRLATEARAPAPMKDILYPLNDPYKEMMHADRSASPWKQGAGNKQ